MVVVCCLSFINTIFGFTEEFFHKYFSEINYSYNFNEKHVIHTFLTCNSSSKKNKVRIFDIPFMEKWTYEITGLILMIYKDEFRFLSSNTILFDESVINIGNDVNYYYQSFLHDFYNFCEKIFTTPLDKYNCFDDHCKNFVNNSLKSLIKNNVILFTKKYKIFLYNLN